jgi:hypothetical protein
MRIFLTSLFISFLSTPAFSQKVVVNVNMQNKIASKNSDTIYYDFDKQLKWSDFTGTPEANHFGGAITSSGFAFALQSDYDGQTIALNINIYSFFLKSKSWKKQNINSDYHLLHEQHHFDITRIGAENLMNELKKASFTKANYQLLIRSIFDKVYNENEFLQKKYDLETNHSRDLNKQEEWNEWIKDELSRIKR